MSSLQATATDTVHPLHELARCPYHPDAPALAGDPARSTDADNAAVRCVACNRAFAITDGIYRLMPDELRVETPDDDESSAEMAQMRREMRQRDTRAPHAPPEKRPPRGSPLYWMNVQYDAVTRLARIDTDGVCVDFGTGVGRYVPWALQRVGRLVATDFSFDSLKQLRQRLTADERARCLLVQCDVARLPLAAGIASSGLSVEVLQHLPSPRLRAAMIENMARTLRPNAPLCLVTKAHTSVVHMVERLRWLRWKLARLRGRAADCPPLGQEHRDGEIYTYWHRHSELRRLVAPFFRIERHLGIVSYGCFPLSRLRHEWALRMDRWLETNPLGRAFGRDMFLLIRRRPD